MKLSTVLLRSFSCIAATAALMQAHAAGFAFADATILYSDGSGHLILRSIQHPDKTVYTGSDEGKLSPDGTKIAVNKGGSVVIMNNDGTNQHEYFPQSWAPNSSANYYPGVAWAYTSAGLFWTTGSTTFTLHRFDPTTNTSSVINIPGGIGDVAQLYFSADGRHAFGGHDPWITLASDFASGTAVLIGNHFWGHGNAMTSDGQYVIFNNWQCDPGTLKWQCGDYYGGDTYHQQATVYRFSDQSYVTTANWVPVIGKDHRLPNWGSPAPIVNNPDYCIIQLEGTGGAGYDGYIVNWRAFGDSSFTDFVHLSLTPAQGSNTMACNGWVGPLPGSGGTSVVFHAQGPAARRAVSVQQTGDGSITLGTHQPGASVNAIFNINGRTLSRPNQANRAILSPRNGLAFARVQDQSGGETTVRVMLMKGSR